ASLGSVGATTRLFPSMTLGCGAPGGNITSDNISPKHLMNIKRIAWESRPVETPPKRLSPQAVAASPPPPAPHPSAPAAVNPSTQQEGRSGAGLPDRATIARVVERFLSQKGVPKGASESVNPAPAPHNPMPAPPERPPAPKAAEFVSESDVRTAMTRSEKIHISPRSIVTPAARDLGNDNSVFVEVEAPTSAPRRS
ncbi:MAG TPA: hypothetical protein VLB32_04880, partial [Candidatus Acidoferrales bacterium]|nr:hypothetical protein [Candidatus Acidoferrales bacterium]